MFLHFFKINNKFTKLLSKNIKIKILKKKKIINKYKNYLINININLSYKYNIFIY